MHQYSGSATPEMSGNSYLLDSSYRPSLNGHPDNHSPSSLLQEGNTSTLTRSQKQPPNQQVSTVSKVVREMHHLAPENSDIDYVSAPYQGDLSGSNIGAAHSQYAGYMDHMAPSEQNRHYNDPYHSNYQDYDVYPNSGGDYGMVYDSMNMSVGQYQPYGNAANYADHSQYSERPPTPPSPSERSDSPPPQQLLAHDFMRKGGPYPASGYDELDATSHMIPRSEHFRITPSPGAVTDRYDQMSNSWNMDENAKPLSIRHGLKWRDPNFTEVISFLTNPNDTVKANAAAYLQHLCYMDDPNKQKTRALGGIPPLVKLLNHESPAVYRNAAGALRNLSYGRQNDENKRVIKLSGGIPLLINLLRKSTDPEVKELVTGILWNLSSCEDLKRTIIDDGLSVLVNHIIIPHSGWSPTGGGTDTCWSTVFRNTSGVLRNVSSAGEFARKKLRECEGLVDSLLYVVKNAIDKSNIGNKSVENCVCVLRNLSYRCQEVEDSNYDKHPIPMSGKIGTNVKAGENLGCFGASKKKKDGQAGNQNRESVSVNRSTTRTEPVTGMELLWQPEVVQVYLTLLQTCSNPETLEAAAGALQNLAACYWQPSIEIRAAVRKDKGLPILVELLRMEVDRVVCAVATALRNLAIDHRNKELIGKYAMRDLVQKLPSGSLTHDQITSDDTIAAVLATLNEVIKKNAEFSRSLLEASGVERLMNITRHRQKYTPRVLKFAGQVLFTMWQHQELREVYKKHGWKEQDFVTKTVAARNAGPNSPSNANSTLNRPMASQGGTRYEDRTLQRPQPVGESSNRSGAPVMSAYQMPNEEIPMPDMSYPEGSSHMPPAGGVRIFPSGPVIKPGEPLYAQVNREKKKNRQYDPSGTETIGSVGSNDAWSGYDDQSQDHHLPQHQSKGMVIDPKSPPSGGDSWV
ncbi:catenin delta-2 isoform X2 [Planococcus citri]